MKKHWDDNPQTPESERTLPARVPARFAIGPVDVRPATVLAPMAGVTDTIFRRFIRNASLFTPAADASATVETAISNQHSGCGLIMTEFTSADGLARMREAKRKRYLTYYDDEHPIAAQLFGSDPRTLSEAAKIVEDAGFDMVDLNLGCPAKRVVACNGGSGLLRDLPLIARTRGCSCDGGAHRLRRRHDRPRRARESVDLPPDRAVHRDWPLRRAHRVGPLSHDPHLLHHAARRGPLAHCWIGGEEHRSREGLP